MCQYQSDLLSGGSGIWPRFQSPMLPTSANPTTASKTGRAFMSRFYRFYEANDEILEQAAGVCDLKVSPNFFRSLASKRGA